MKQSNKRSCLFICQVSSGSSSGNYIATKTIYNSSLLVKTHLPLSNIREGSQSHTIYIHPTILLKTRFMNCAQLYIRRIKTLCNNFASPSISPRQDPHFLISHLHPASRIYKLSILLLRPTCNPPILPNKMLLSSLI